MRRATDWCIAGLLAVVFATSVLVFHARRPGPYPPVQGCEADRHYTTAGQLLCGKLQHPHSTVGVLYPTFTALVAEWIEPTYLAGKLVSLFFGGLLIGLIYLAGLAHTGSRVIAGGAAVLAGANASVFYYGTLACTDLTAAFFAFLALHYALGALRRDWPWPRPLLAGACGVLACLVRDQFYFFVAGLAVALLFLPRAKDGKRFLILPGFIVGVLAAFAVYLAIATKYFATDVSDALGWTALISRRAELASVVAGRTGLGAMLAPLLARYHFSLKLVAQLVGRLPLLLGLVAAVALLLRPRYRRLAIAPLIPLAIYFLGVGWYSTEGVVDDRFFLIFEPVLAIFFSAGVCALVGLMVGRRAALGRAIGLAAVLATAALLGRADLPQMPHFDPILRPGVPDVPPAQVFRLQQQIRCELVMTPSLEAGAQFNRTYLLADYYRQQSVNNARLVQIMSGDEMASERCPCYVMLPANAEQKGIVPGVPFGPGDRYQLDRMYRLYDRVFYRLTDRGVTKPRE